MKVLVTGARGFIGSNLVAALARKHEVYATARVPGDPVEGVTWIPHDLREPLALAAFPAAVDTVVHLAQSRRYRDFPDGAEDVFALNVHSTFALLDYARRANAARFVFTSTGGVYGHGDESFVEEDTVNPINFYLASKYAAETLIAPFVSELHAVVLRLFFVYGPGQTQMLVPSLAARVLEGSTVTIDGDPGIRINPIFVDDAVRALERAIEHESSLLCNVAGDETVTLTELTTMLARIAGREPRIVHAPAAHVGDIVGDNARMRRELGVTPEVGLRQGLERVLGALA